MGDTPGTGGSSTTPTYTAGGIGSRESITHANDRGAFKNTQFIFSGTAVGAGSAPAVGTNPPSLPSIFFGPQAGAPTAAGEYTFQIDNINTSYLQDLRLYFKLYSASTSGSSFIVEYNANKGAGWIEAYNSTSANSTWSLKDATLAGGAGTSNLSLRFRKPANSSAAREFRMDDVQLTGTPVLQVTPASLNFGPLPTSQTVTQSFVVKSSELTNPVNITLPADSPFTISTSTTGFSNNVTLIPTSGNVNTTVYVQFAPTQLGDFSEIITLDSDGASGTTVTVSGTGTSFAPTLTVTPPSLDFGNVAANGSGKTLPFQVKGNNLTGTITLTASTAVQFRDPDAGGGFVSTMSLTPSSANGSLTKTIEVRTTSGAPIGAFTGEISLVDSKDNVSAQVAISAINNGADAELTPSGAAPTKFSTVPNVASAYQTYTVAGTNLQSDITITAPSLFQVSFKTDFSDITAGATGNTIKIAGPRDSEGNVTSYNVSGVPIYFRYLPTDARDVNNVNIFITSQPATTKTIQVSGTSMPSVELANAFTPAANVVLGSGAMAGQTMAISAKRVLKPITLSIAADDNQFNPSKTPQYEVSEDNTTWGSTVVINPDASTYSATKTIYVRYNPTYLGKSTTSLLYQTNDSNIKTPQTFSSNTDGTNNGTLTGNAIANQPINDVAASINVQRDLEAGTAVVNFNLPAGYNSQSNTQGYGENRLIVVSLNSTLPAGSQPVDGTSYDINSGIYGGTASSQQVAPGYYVVYAGSASSATITGLDKNRAYYFYSYEFNNLFTYVNSSNQQVTVGVQNAENYKTPSVPVSGIVAPGIFLPVELISFDAKLRKGHVYASWATASEVNNEGFHVERSQDGKAFTSVSYQKGQGTTANKTSYEAIDNQPLAGSSYYRLKQVDLDGKVSYSPVVTIVNTAALITVSVYPNPTQDIATINLGQLPVAGTQVQLTDMMGRTIRTQQLSTTGELNMRDLKPGTYFITIQLGDQKVVSKVVKN
ncbi:hypothetical protein GCM10011383_39120 [Hymenobacter cavernae]|uniref:Secretion system C-terminal sorting domain-containing protein n=2 Tax=Hymenobacter cavernae TaxID=2044852 RepID=A0ABQ1UPX7_9BACT|nr:hypothetical protein GCM10011383_39120 [Hymenobacter cavernae]